MRHNVIWPQFHGREHLNVPMWMQMLRDNVAQAYHAFDRGFFAFDVSLPNDPRTHALQAFNVLHKDEYTFAIQSVVDGLDLFEKIFGFRSFSMIAPCYIWDGDIECAAVNGGVRIMQGGHVQVVSAYAKSQGGKSIRHFIGDKNRYGQLYLVRNCTFEPTQSSLFNADFCMAGITSAFKFRKPAVVSCHRLNFIGEINPANRDCNLREFGRLLKMIVARYPDVEFMSSDELGRIIFEETDNIK